MLGSAILEVAISVVFIYLLVRSTGSSIREGVESWTKTRALGAALGWRMTAFAATFGGVTCCAS